MSTNTHSCGHKSPTLSLIDPRLEQIALDLERYKNNNYSIIKIAKCESMCATASVD